MASNEAVLEHQLKGAAEAVAELLGCGVKYVMAGRLLMADRPVTDRHIIIGQYIVTDEEDEVVASITSITNNFNGEGVILRNAPLMLMTTLPDMALTPEKQLEYFDMIIQYFTMQEAEMLVAGMVSAVMGV